MSVNEHLRHERQRRLLLLHDDGGLSWNKTRRTNVTANHTAPTATAPASATMVDISSSTSNNRTRKINTKTIRIPLPVTVTAMAMVLLLSSLGLDQCCQAFSFSPGRHCGSGRAIMTTFQAHSYPLLAAPRIKSVSPVSVLSSSSCLAMIQSSGSDGAYTFYNSKKSNSSKSDSKSEDAAHQPIPLDDTQQPQPSVTEVNNNQNKKKKSSGFAHTMAILTFPSKSSQADLARVLCSFVCLCPVYPKKNTMPYQYGMVHTDSTVQYLILPVLAVPYRTATAIQFNSNQPGMIYLVPRAVMPLETSHANS
jgi:hypothetical protein